MNQHNLLYTTFFASIILMSAFCGCQSDAERSSAHEKQTISLFNGKNLDGWYTYLKGYGKNNDPNQVFTVEDGMIRITGEDWGSIITEEEYENYHLIAEYRWGGPTHEPRKNRARDCGLLLHSVGEDGAWSDTWMYSIEANIIEGGTGDFIVVGDKSENFSVTSPVAPEKQNGSWIYQHDGQMETIHSGRINWWGRDPGWQDTLGFRGSQDIEHPIGEWNRIECIAQADSIIVILNDQVVNKGYDVKPQKGRIQIQSEAAEIYFRKVDLIPL